VDTGFRKDHAPAIKHDPEKWIPVFGKDHAPPIEHDPEKACPRGGGGGYRFSEKDYAPAISWSGMTIRRKVIPV
jgi:hypothetical protein